MEKFKQLPFKKIIPVILCIAVAAVSYFLIADKMGDVNFHSGTIASLDKTRNKVMELAAASVAASSAITLIPGDVGTPVAEKLADMSTYFLIVLCAVYLEKFLLTVTGYAAFKYIIPAACLIFIAFIASNKQILAKIAAKLLLFGLVISFTIPVSVKIAGMIEDSYGASIQSALDKAKENTRTATDSAGKTEGDGNALERILNNVTDGARELLNKFENTLSLFIEATAVLIVTSCLVPIGVLLFFLWVVKLLFSIEINIHKFPRKHGES